MNDDNFMKSVSTALMIGLALLVGLAIGNLIGDNNKLNNAPCAEFKNYRIRNIPARCLSEYMK